MFFSCFPGRLIAEIFKKYGNRLLEQNVRSYLSIRQKGVNRGILTTIEKNPKMFFAFNNGLTVTVSKIEVENNNIISMTDLQVVNGGQTSNTLLYALQKNNQPLSEIFVQAKIMIVLKVTMKNMYQKLQNAQIFKTL